MNIGVNAKRNLENQNVLKSMSKGNISSIYQQMRIPKWKSMSINTKRRRLDQKVAMSAVDKEAQKKSTTTIEIKNIGPETNMDPIAENGNENYWEEEVNKEKRNGADGLREEESDDDAKPIPHPYAREKPTNDNLKEYFTPIVFPKGSKRYYGMSMIWLFLSKSCNIMSPFFLKSVVDSLTYAGTSGAVGVVGMSGAVKAVGAATAAGASLPSGAMTLSKTIKTLAMWGLSVVGAKLFIGWQMNSLTKGIQKGLRNVAAIAHEHQFKLDPYYHKNRSTNTVFEINNAMRTLASGLRFFFGFCA